MLKIYTFEDRCRHIGYRQEIAPLANLRPTIKCKKYLAKPSDPDVIALAEDIREHRQKKPIFVRRHRDEPWLMVLDGHHRLAALKLLKRKWCRVVIMETYPHWRTWPPSTSRSFARLAYKRDRRIKPRW